MDTQQATFNAWLTVTAALVFLMQGGFTVLACGLVRHRAACPCPGAPARLMDNRVCFLRGATIVPVREALGLLKRGNGKQSA